MSKLRKFADGTFAEPLMECFTPQYQEVAKVTYHVQPVDIDRDERYYTVKFGHVQDPNKFATFAEAEAYIRIIHSLKE